MNTRKTARLQNIHDYEISILDIFDGEKFAKLAYDNSALYKENKPFPHIVFDNFLPQSVAEVLSNEYPEIKNKNSEFKSHENQNVIRHFLEDTRYFSYNLKLLSASISARSFLLFLETLTGIKALIPDPYFMGGGAMMTGKNGFLNVHVDFNWHQKLQAWRRCNVLFYLTKEWKSEYGGNLELWSSDGRSKLKEIEPLFNRLIIFDTTSESYHGQPNRIICPGDVYRNVFSAFYYSTQKHEKTDSNPHFTKYITADESENIAADFETSPYAEGITKNYLKNI